MYLPLLLGLVSVALVLPGCGRIVDPNNIVIAEVDGKPIRQRHFNLYLRHLDEVDRPLIQNREDAVRALNTMIDDRIKDQYAGDFKALGQISVDRAVAREAYFLKHPDLRMIYEMPENALEQDLEPIRAQVEFGVDDEESRLYREAALTRMAQAAYKNGSISVSDEEIGEEYAKLAAQTPSPITRLERVEFVGIRFPTDDPHAREEAANIRRRVAEGADFDAIVSEVRAKDPTQVLEATFENDVRKVKFQTFWEDVHGADPGQVILTFLPDFEKVTSIGGRAQSTPMEASGIVLKIVSHTPEGVLKLDEARDYLITVIIRQKMMQQLREKHGVAVYADAIHDPAGFGDQFKNSTIRTRLDQ